MSFRELRTFTETMRLLGYSRTISVESFRVPNVELVAEVLYWLTKRYEPSAEIAYEIERESDRVTFFRRCCETVLFKGRIKLNVKKLYQADGHAVQELLKLANVLRGAIKARKEEPADYSALQSQASQKGHHEAKLIRQLCTDLTDGGSSLYFLLEQEMLTRHNRSRVMSRATEISEFERRLRDMLQSIGQQVETLNNNVTNLSADATNLEQKIESKKAQQERAQKRLTSLLKVRPAFMEEYDRLEGELHQQFVTYLEHYRNLEYLENELSKFNSKEDALLAEQETKLKVMRERLRKEELQVLRGAHGGGDDDFVDSDDEDTDSDDDPAAAAAQKAALMNQQRVDHSRGEIKRPRAASGRERPPPTSNVAGSMFAAGNDDSDDETDSDEDDSDDETLSSDSDDDDDGDLLLGSDSDDEDSDDDDSGDDDDETDSDM